jgi:hypothetical protein
MLIARGIIGRSIKKSASSRATRSDVVQRPTADGGVSHLLPTNAMKMISCVSLPDATIMSVPIYDFAMANEELAKK